MNNQDIRLLRIFLTIFQVQNLSRAAEQLDMSQPSVSHSLAKLRVLFQDPLLIRTRGGMLPTRRAEQLAKSVQKLLLDYAELIMPIDEFDPATSQRQFIMTAPEHAEHMLSPILLSTLRREAPCVRLDVRAPQPDRAQEWLESGEIDLRIAWLLKPQMSLRSIELFQDRMVYIADKDHPDIRGHLSLQQFLRFPHVRAQNANRNTTNRVIDDAIEKLGKEPIFTLQLQNFMTMPAALIGTDIIAPVPLGIAERFMKSHDLQILEPPIKLPRMRYCAYWHERNHHDEGHRWFRSKVLAAARHCAAS